MSAEGHSPLRVLAPASLVVFAVVLLIVVAVSVSGSEDKGSGEPAATRTTKEVKRSEKRTRTTSTGRLRRFYTVKPGDNLATIAEQTGVQLDRLRAANPTLDPQGLVSGQRVKLPPPSG
jgi:LysM repeat protein